MLHRWSGWPGAWCLDCGCEDIVESAVCDSDWDFEKDPLPEKYWVHESQQPCKKPNSNEYNPYYKKDLDNGTNKEGMGTR